jgi:hypothetical protein
MSTAHEIPLVPQPQRFIIALGNVQYRMFIHWCDPAAAWVLDIFDIGNTPIVLGIPLVTGANLLQQFAYLGIKGSLVVQTDHDTFAVATFTNLGKEGHLYFVN